MKKSPGFSARRMLLTCTSTVLWCTYKELVGFTNRKLISAPFRGRGKYRKDEQKGKTTVKKSVGGFFCLHC